MDRARITIFALSLLGLAWSAWSARPDDFTSAVGWGFAIVWASLAWLALCFCVRYDIPLPAAIGAFVILVVCELLMRSRGLDSDGFIFAVKPIYEVPAAVLSALSTGWIFRHEKSDA